jgi:hypothetical protein
MVRTDLSYITAGYLRTKSWAASRAVASADLDVYTRTLAPTGSGFRHDFSRNYRSELKMF